MCLCENDDSVSVNGCPSNFKQRFFKEVIVVQNSKWLTWSACLWLSGWSLGNMVWPVLFY